MKIAITPIPSEPKFKPFKVEIEIRTSAEGLALLAMLNCSLADCHKHVEQIVRLTPSLNPAELSALKLFSKSDFSDNIYLTIRQALLDRLL